MENLYLDEVIDNAFDLHQAYVFRDGFAFTAIDEPTNVYDAIIIRNPSRCRYWAWSGAYSGYSLEDHIELINRYKIEKAKIVAEDIGFITQCPSLKYLSIVPADTAPPNFDYSPLYDMPEVRSLVCQTRYGGSTEQCSTTIDCARIRGLRKLAVHGKGYLNFDRVESLEELFISEYKGLEHLKNLCASGLLKKLTFLSCSFPTLDGIEAFPHLQSFNVWYNRTLHDISALHNLVPSLRELTVQNCPKIADFSCLSELSNMEALSLEGKNDLPNLNFLRNMPRLRFFYNEMNVVDGDLTPCLSVPYVHIKGRKHYNYRDKDLPKNADPEGFSLI